MVNKSFVLFLLFGIAINNHHVLCSNSEPGFLKGSDYSYYDECVNLQMVLDTIPASADELEVNSVVFNIDTTYTGYSLGATEFEHQKAITQSALQFGDQSIKRTWPLPFTVLNWHLLIQRYIFDLK